MVERGASLLSSEPMATGQRQQDKNARKAARAGWSSNQDQRQCGSEDDRSILMLSVGGPPIRARVWKDGQWKTIAAESYD